MATLAELGMVLKSQVSEAGLAEPPVPVNQRRRVKGQPRLDRNVATPESQGYSSASSLDRAGRDRVRSLAGDQRWRAKQKTGSPLYRSPFDRISDFISGSTGNPFRDQNAKTVLSAETASRAHRLVGGKRVSDLGVRELGTAPAMTFRIGGKNTGSSHIVRNKSGMRAALVVGRTRQNDVMRHEALHAKPRRSQWRAARIFSDPARSAREEARAVTWSTPMLGRERRLGTQSTYDQRALTGMRTPNLDMGEYARARLKYDRIRNGPPKSLMARLVSGRMARIAR